MIDVLEIESSAAALREYTGAFSGAVNRFLRSGSDGGERYTSYIESLVDRLDEVMAGAELIDDIVVYRGVRNWAFGYGDDPVFNRGEDKFFDYSSIVGLTLFEAGFISTSRNQAIARCFGPVLMEIRVPAGVRALDVDQVLGPRVEEECDLEPESEVLLDRGLSFRVDSVDSPESETILHVMAVS